MTLGGLVEPHAEMPDNIEVDSGRARFDATDLTIRQINMALRKLIYNDGIVNVTVLNPSSKHSLAVGILKRCRIHFEGSPGWFACGLIDGPEVTIKRTSGLVALRKHDVGRGRGRARRRLAHRSRDPRR